MVRVIVSGLFCLPAISQAQIYVTQYGGTIGIYGLTGQAINPILVPTSPSAGAPGRIAVDGDRLYVARYIRNIEVHDAVTGALIDDSLIPQAGAPLGLAIVGSNLFVTTEGTTQGGAVRHYTTSGAVVNASLITGLQRPIDVAVSGEDLWVLDNGSATVGRYTTSGAPVNASLITGLETAIALALSDGKLFILRQGDEGQLGSLGVYDAFSGAAINPTLITGLQVPSDLALYQGNLFITMYASNRVAQYATSGTLVNPSLFFVDSPRSIAVVPEPGLGLLLVVCGLCLKRRSSVRLG
jgi:hypothetical protein